MMWRLPGEFRMHKETENVRTVIDRHGDDAVPGHTLAVIARLRPVAVLKPAAEDVYQDWKFLAIRLGGRPDVEVQAILVHAVAAEPVVRDRASPLLASRP